MEINVKINEDDIVIVSVKGSINSVNANEFEASLKEYPSIHNGIYIDFKDLDYISSAGLRVILSVKKRCNNLPFKVINVSNDVKSIFDVTGFSEIIDIEKRVREISIEGCKMIGHGACGECYRLDDETIVKLYYSHISDEEIENEKALAKKAFVMGIPTAISFDVVECNGRKGVIYELIKSKTLTELIRENPENKEHYLDMFANVVKKINSIHSDDPLLPNFKDVNRNDIKKVVGISEIEREYLYKFIDLIPEGNTVIHGDLNLNNIMVENDECVLIDMGDLSKGNSLFDFSRIAFSMIYANPENGINTFYNLPSSEINELFNGFINRYFGCSLEQAIKNNENGKWILPLTWFRVVTAMIRENRFPLEKVEMAKDILKNKLIPFIKNELKEPE